jgi:hypothetical protein
MEKLVRFTTLPRENGIPVRQSKRLLHLLRAVTAFPASSATFVQRLITKSLDNVGPDRVRKALHPLVDDFAVKLLTG